ncbi:MAG TPA: transcription antitermination factor NusB [Bacillus sp. (in: firmicutes)]|uniref:transcription antitermination factor NusB n=1 Tax=Bacillus litorisediminis TaxID=2922713 RepID=UPI001FAD68D5|nr:transcription antitermination factor NusB [Bacillus litorisediminis]HWO76224.1 transcription antitermination factor NusB [Bacillus sp. (in: firmicutes)]
MKRRTAREKALQALYQIEVSKASADEAIENILEGEESDDYLTFLINGVVTHQSEIDSTIEKHLQKWRLDRLSVVDRNLLRLATFELLHSESVPSNVVLNEAIEIAKIYGDDNSSKFINGVLSNIKQNNE